MVELSTLGRDKLGVVDGNEEASRDWAAALKDLFVVDGDEEEVELSTLGRDKHGVVDGDEEESLDERAEEEDIGVVDGNEEASRDRMADPEALFAFFL